MVAAVDTVTRTCATLTLVTRAIEQHRSQLDSYEGLRTLTLMIRYDKRTGQPTIVNQRPEFETT